MNFLAHCALAWEANQALADVSEARCQGLLAGAVIGDFVKGGVPQELPDALQDGVRLHRHIDASAHGLSGIKRTCARFPDSIRRFAPIYTDLVADITLTRHWDTLYPIAMPDLTRASYASIDAYSSWVPTSAERFVRYAKQEDLLARYAEPEVLNHALSSIHRRLGSRAPTLAGQAILELLFEVERASAQEFTEYFQELRQVAKTWAANRSHAS